MSVTEPSVLTVGQQLSALQPQLRQHYRALDLGRCEAPAALLAEQYADVQVLVTTGVYEGSANLIEQFPTLHAIVCLDVGTDTGELNFADARGIQVSNTHDVLNDCVADVAMALPLAVARQVLHPVLEGAQ